MQGCAWRERQRVKTYTTKSGDQWDRIAHDRMGSEDWTDRLIWANPAYRETYIFPAGVVLTIPEAPAQAAEELPPWKR